MACRLQARGDKVALVVLLDAADARAPKVGASSARAKRFSAAFGSSKLQLRKVVSVAGRKLANLVKYETGRRVLHLKNRVRVRLLQEFTRREMSPPELLQDIGPRVVYEFAQASYEPGQFSGAVLLLRATEASPSQVNEGIDDTPAIQTTSDPLLGWGRRTTAGVDVVDVPGGHSSMLQQPHVTKLAEALEARISKALG
jgi:thioesterase domain-containing protein